MAGEIALPIQESPDLLTTIVVPCGSTGGVVVDNQFLFYAEKDTVIDAAWCVFGVNDSDATLKLTTAATGAIASGTDLTSALAIDGTAGTPVQFTITETANLIPAGSWVGMEITGTSTASEMVIQLRIRQKIR
jgi:hypothetical protein